jgi:hypothetical protein
MASVSYKILGQAAPTAGTEVTLYTVPSATNAVGSSIVACNRSNSYTTINVSASKAGATTSNKDYIYYSLTIGAYDTFVGAVGLTLGATDVIRVSSVSGNVSFTLFGSEIT